jgi:hypothetical protein
VEVTVSETPSTAETGRILMTLRSNESTKIARWAYWVLNAMLGIIAALLVGTYRTFDMISHRLPGENELPLAGLMLWSAIVLACSLSVLIPVVIGFATKAETRDRAMSLDSSGSKGVMTMFVVYWIIWILSVILTGAVAMFILGFDGFGR